MDENEKFHKIHELTTKIMDILNWSEEDTADNFDYVMDVVEAAIEDESIPMGTFDKIFGKLDFKQQQDILFEIQMTAAKLKENKMNFEKIYKISEGSHKPNRLKTAVKGSNGPFDEWNPKGTANKNGDYRPPIKGTPNFKFDDGGYGPIPTTGHGRREYEAKYAKKGGLIESKMSPALQEGISDHKIAKQLLEKNLINVKDLDLLKEDYDDYNY